MDINEPKYEKTELVRIAEQIYDCNEKKKQLELQLNDEQFHYRYIPKRKGIVIHEVIFRLLFFIIPITYVIMFTFGNYFWFFFDAFLIYFDIRLIIREIRMLCLLVMSINTPFMLTYAKKHDLNTFQKEQYRSEQKINYLQEEIENINQQVTDLEAKKKRLLEEKTHVEAILRKEGVLFDENPKISATSGKFNLKKESTGTQNVEMVYEFYKNEERNIQNNLIRLEGQLHHTEKQIVEINENFLEIKKKIIISLVVFGFLILIQSAFTGIVAIVTNFICLIAGLLYVFYVERKWRQPVLLYFIENDSNLTKEYAFINNIIPIKMKREELLNRIDHYKKELIDIKKKRESIIFS